MQGNARRSLWTPLVFAAYLLFVRAARAEESKPVNPQGAAWEWDQPEAKVLENGDLQWDPHPFVFERGESPKYIDFDSGNDDNDGAMEKPFKHHPWDVNATGQAAACKGIHTYVFKRGVIYRGSLVPAESGAADNPIRLTSDPAWGAGEAAIYGSTKITSGWKQCTAADAPASMPEPEKVWYLDLAKAPSPRCIFEIRGADTTRIHIARTPNYKAPTTDDVMADWYTWTGPNAWSAINQDTAHLTQTDPHYYDGASIWSEWGDNFDNMGLPRVFAVKAYDPAHHAITRDVFVHGKANVGHRYYMEDLPAFLDAPGEFYHSDKGAHPGRLYLRLPEDRDPNKSEIELGRETRLIDLLDRQHISITGLRFSYMNIPQSLAAKYPAIYYRPSAIQLTGDCRDIRIANCHFYEVPCAIQGSPRLCPDGLKAYAPNLPAKHDVDIMEDINVTDNDIAHADSAAIEFLDGGAVYGSKSDDQTIGELGRIRILRNRVFDAVYRNGYSGNGPAIGVSDSSLSVIAGNIVDSVWGVGIWCVGGKNGGDERNRPLIRNIIHHNKVTNALLAANDWGAIASWQGGNCYIYNNVVGNPLGPKHHVAVGDNFHMRQWSCNGFAIYLDGMWKSYLFNNIVWGKFNNLDQWLKDRSAFMMVIGFQNNWFNNTVYKYCFGVTGSAGQRTAIVGNVFSDISNAFFGQDAPGDISLHAGEIKGDKLDTTSAAATLAYASNIFFGQPENFGHAVGKEMTKTLDAFKTSLDAFKPRAGDVGVQAEQNPLSAPEKGDFRLKEGSAAAGRGVKFFVPWSLYMTVGEWTFTRLRADPTVVIGENMFMSDEYVSRDMYYEIPRNDLTVPGAKSEDYVKGALNDWSENALVFNGKDRFCVLADKEIKSDYATTERFGDVKGKRGVEKGNFTYPGAKRRTVDMDTNNFLIEVHFKSAPQSHGTLVAKLDKDTGYSLAIDAQGHPLLTLRAGNAVFSTNAPIVVNDGQWRHLLADVDRKSGFVALYVDGKQAATAKLTLDATATLVNSGDFLIGKTSDAQAPDFFSGTLDFLRVARGTLADSKTTITELYAWEFNGPWGRDFCGQLTQNGKRDAGAIQFRDQRTSLLPQK